MTLDAVAVGSQDLLLKTVVLSVPGLCNLNENNSNVLDEEEKNSATMDVTKKCFIRNKLEVYSIFDLI